MLEVGVWGDSAWENCLWKSTKKPLVSEVGEIAEARAGEHVSTQNLASGSVAEGKAPVFDGNETVWTAVSRRFVAEIGDGSNTTFTVNHLFGTRFVSVSVWQTSHPFGLVTDYTAEATTTNSITLVFDTPPSLNSVSVVVVG